MILVDGLHVEYGGFTLGPLSFKVRDGERVALVGANGAGKSTTLKAISGLLRSTRAGTVRVDGVDVDEAGPRIRWTVGLLPERIAGFGWMTVAEHLRFLRAFHSNWDRQYEADLLKRVDLPVNTKLANLSKGMQVKLSLVAAESYRPAVLLLDEPTSGIDPVMRHEIIEVLRECVPEGGTRTIIFSSHILEDVEHVAARVLLLREGRLIDDLSVDTLRRHPRRASVSEQLIGRLRAL